ncbi:MULTISPECIES: MFS transporter [Streptomyces]|uniref:Spectinomycin tetracycline efflux pump n=1 Tax=Streptomyces chartreusis NRRL 3882 TaxID=1079985 RepID=A0A2N9B3W3_STRCX|nr:MULTISPECIES: MFS transporter [Streptomyces]MYS88848.1 DHA2 family efflux MFS transporter permease subunit [Streptomyces sp. SID5464]SOR78031.1 Spectinomycin tetracycline efflux pump [Streptomyces chartreusis NRRL 3882]
MTHSTAGAPHTAEHAHQPPADPRRWAALALICLAQFMLILDVTVVNVALPDMAADLDLGRETLTWVVTAYTLCFGGLILLGGRLADAFGARRTVLAGLALFTAASLVTGLAGNAPTLLGGRIGQGVGAALLSPAALSLVTTTFHGPERNKALGVWAAIGGTGSAAGVILGGALTDGPGWQWVFYVNVPVGLLLLAALPVLVPARAPQPARLDIPGALLVTTGTAALIYGLVKAGDTGWSDASTLLPLAGAAVAYAAFAAVERAGRAPLMDLRMFTRRSVLAGAFLMLIATALLIAFFFLGSVYLQHLRGFSPLRTGLVFLPVAVATAVGAHLGSRLVGRIGSRPTAVVGMAVAAAGTIPLTRLSETGSAYTGLMPGFVIASLGLGAVFVTATTTALAMVEHQEAGLASGVVNTFHEVGGSIGVAVVSTVAASGFERGSAGGFADAFVVCAVTAVVAAVLALGLVPRGRPRSTGAPLVH